MPTKYEERALEITLPEELRRELLINFSRCVLLEVQPFADVEAHDLASAAANWIGNDYAKLDNFDDDYAADVVGRLLRELDALYSRGVAVLKRSATLADLFYEFEKLVETLASAFDLEDVLLIDCILRDQPN